MGNNKSKNHNVDSEQVTTEKSSVKSDTVGRKSKFGFSRSSQNQTGKAEKKNVATTSKSKKTSFREKFKKYVSAREAVKTGGTPIPTRRSRGSKIESRDLAYSVDELHYKVLHNEVSTTPQAKISLESLVKRSKSVSFNYKFEDSDTESYEENVLLLSEGVDYEMHF